MEPVLGWEKVTLNLEKNIQIQLGTLKKTRESEEK